MEEDTEAEKEVGAKLAEIIYQLLACVQLFSTVFETLHWQQLLVLHAMFVLQEDVTISKERMSRIQSMFSGDKREEEGVRKSRSRSRRRRRSRSKMMGFG